MGQLPDPSTDIGIGSIQIGPVSLARQIRFLFQDKAGGLFGNGSRFFGTPSVVALCADLDVFR